MSEDLIDEFEQIRVDNIYSQMSDNERGKMLKKLLGPLLEPSLLTPKESAFFFLASAHGKSTKAIAAAMGTSQGTTHNTITRAKNKIKKYRKGRFWDA